MYIMNNAPRRTHRIQGAQGDSISEAQSKAEIEKRNLRSSRRYDTSLGQDHTIRSTLQACALGEFQADVKKGGRRETRSRDQSRTQRN